VNKFDAFLKEVARDLLGGLLDNETKSQ